MRAATELVATGHYPKRTEPFYFRAPGYPYFLAAATLGHPRSVAAGKAINAVLGALAAVLLAAFSARIFGSRPVAIATGIAAALHPGLVMLSTDVQSEPLFVVLLLISGYLLLAAADRPSSNLAIAAGAALALAALTRPAALALCPLLAAPLFDRRWPLRARAQVAASGLLGLTLALFPWTLRNAIVFHELVPINDAGGSAFYQGNSDWMVRFYEIETPQEYSRWIGASFSDLERQTRAVDAASGGSPSALSRHFVDKTFQERGSDLAGWGRLLALKAWDWLRPYPHPLFWPRWVLWLVGAVNTAVMILAAIGLFRAPRPGVRAFAAAYLVLSMAVHVALIVVWRYRIASWDPVLLLYAGWAAWPRR
jgi:4-amino-4-deoxy-L-arabinose transferase-like glycosyltransferase